MNRLIHANFARLKKNKLFWIGFLGMFVFGAGVSLYSYFRGIKPGYQPARLNDVFFLHQYIIGILAATFCSLFLSTEYREGAIRNKLIVGHKRSAIYLSNLIVNCVAMLIMTAVYTFAVCAVAMPLMGGFKGMETAVVLKLLVVTTFALLSYTTLFTMIGMLNQNTAIVTVISFIVALALLFGSDRMDEQLRSPVVNASFEADESGELKVLNSEPNPYYIDGAKRTVYEFLNDFLPSGQCVQVIKMSDSQQDLAPEIVTGIVVVDDTHLWRSPLYSILFMVITTGVGMFVFRRKDLK